MTKRLCFAAVAACVLAACTKPLAVVPDTLRYPMFAEPVSLDPAVAQDPDGTLVHGQLHHGLTKFDVYGRLLAGLADHWDVSPDKRNYVFFLREAKWGDGAPVKAEEFRAAWLRLLAPSAPAPGADLLKGIEGAEDFRAGKTTDPATIKVVVEGDRRLRVLLVQPDAQLPERLASPLLGPQRTDPVMSTGPFLLANWEKGNRLVLSANPYFYGGRPAIRTLEFVFLKDTASALVHYERGDLDVLVPVGTSDRERLRHSAEFVTTIVRRGFANGPTAPFEKLDILVRTGLEGFAIDKTGLPRFERAFWKVK